MSQLAYPEFPDEGKGFDVAGRSEQSIVIALNTNMPSGLDWHAVASMQENLPLTSEIYSVNTPKTRAREVALPSVEALNSWGERHLRELGATTMEVVQVPGGDLPAEGLVDNFAEGRIPLASKPVYFFHDITDHVIGALTLAETQTEIWQQIAQQDQALRETDPENADTLAVLMASTFDQQTSVNSRFFLVSSLCREEPMLLSSFQKYNSAFGNEVIAEIVDAAIDEPPEVEGRDLVGDTKLARWADWEEAVMPEYGANIVAKLSEQPAVGFGKRVGRLLSRLLPQM